MGLFQLLFGSSTPRADEVQALHLAPSDDFTFDIVGEASYQQALDELCGGKCEDGHNVTAVAQLCLQEDNPYDANAVVVLIDQRIVGYIPRDKAPWIRSEILRINPDERPVTCNAKIVGGWRRASSDEGHYGVKLSLVQPLQSAT